MSFLTKPYMIADVPAPETHPFFTLREGLNLDNVNPGLHREIFGVTFSEEQGMREEIKNLSVCHRQPEIPLPLLQHSEAIFAYTLKNPTHQLWFLSVPIRWQQPLSTLWGFVVMRRDSRIRHYQEEQRLREEQQLREEHAIAEAREREAYEVQLKAQHHQYILQRMYEARDIVQSAFDKYIATDSADVGHEIIKEILEPICTQLATTGPITAEETKLLNWPLDDFEQVHAHIQIAPHLAVDPILQGLKAGIEILSKLWTSEPTGPAPPPSSAFQPVQAVCSILPAASQQPQSTSGSPKDAFLQVLDGDLIQLRNEVNNVRRAIQNKEGVENYASSIELLLARLDTAEQGWTFVMGDAPEYVARLKELRGCFGKLLPSKRSSRACKNLERKVGKALKTLKQA